MRFTFVALLSLSLAACGSSPPPLTGRYYKDLAWIEFGPGGKVRHGEFGDTAKFRMEDKQRVVVTEGANETTGRVIAPDTVEFPGGATAVAEAFAGTWVKPAETATASASTPGSFSVPGSKGDSKPLVGEWGAPGDTGNLTFRDNGSFQWGQTITGTYEVLDATRLRLRVLQDGRPSGQMDCTYAVQGILLRLQMTDGTKVVYQRVK